MVSTLEPSTTLGEDATGVTRDVPAISPLVERDRTRAITRMPQPVPGRYLAVPDGDAVALVPLREPTTRVGRSHAADVVLEDQSISRRHAIIVRRDNRTVLLDDRSLNGIQVNGQHVSEAALAHGDVILFGRIEVRYVEVPA
jgi:pSer/pThr/pTyr-binding forkhead associated (FHA) protein